MQRVRSSFSGASDQDKPAPTEPQSPVWVITPAPKSSNTATTPTALNPYCLPGKAKETPVPEFRELICLHLREPTSPSRRGVYWHGFQSNLDTLKAQLSSSAQISCKSVRGSPYTSLCGSLKSCRVED